MKEKLALLFLFMLVLSLAQDGCQESRLDKIQTGEIVLNPNDLGTAGSNKNYYESLSRGNFEANEVLATAVAIAGFETSCSQTSFSLIVDIVEPQSENTKLKLVIDFRNKAQTNLTTWTKVKLSYLVVSYLRVSATNINEDIYTKSSLIWATSQYVDLAAAISNAAVLTDPVLLGDYDAGNGCGLYYSTGKWRYGIRCDKTINGNTNPTVDFDVAVHTYIMGFHYTPIAGAPNNFLAAEVKYENFADNIKKYELAFYEHTDSSKNHDRKEINNLWISGSSVKTDLYGIKFAYSNLLGGPVYKIENQNNELQGIKIAVVFSVVNAMSSTNGAADNGFGAQKLTYSYSGLFTDVAPEKFNIKTLIEDDKQSGYNNLHERLPMMKYAIYGFSSFALADGSGCTSFSLDLTLDSVNAFTVSTNQKSSLTKVVIQSDQYSPRIQSLCSPSVQFRKFGISGITTTDNPNTLTATTDLDKARKGQKTNLKYMKTRLSEKYETIPSSSTDQYIQQTSDNPLSINFVVMSKKDITEFVNMNAEIVMTGLTAGKSYGISFILSPETDATNGWPTIPNANYEYSLKVNGFSVVKLSYTKIDMENFKTAQAKDTASKRIPGAYANQFGINIPGTTATFTFSVTVPRDSTVQDKKQDHQIIVDLFEIQQVYDPITQCCVSRCPAQTGVDITLTPPACVVCDESKGLSYDPSTSSCKCADSFYLSASLLYQCFPCETKLCAECQSDKPKFCNTCLAGATLNLNDKTCACSGGFFENNGICTRCATKCLTCSVAAICNTCADSNRDLGRDCSCNAGFYDAGVDKCATCSSNCATCSSATTCLSCDASRFRVLRSTLCVCQDGYFELVHENGGRVCTRCSPECKTCAQTATECGSCDATVNRVVGYDSLGHSTCVCNAGYKPVTNGGCVQSDCKTDQWCSECQTDLAVCSQCQVNANRVLKLPQYHCVCADGFYEAANQCNQCSSGCAKCSSATNCTSCVSLATNYGDGTCRCPDETFFGVSQDGVRYCRPCIRYCNKCSNELTCQTCKSTFVLSADNTCVCPIKKFINAQGECVPCKAGCENCANATNCEKCQAPLVLQNNSCIQRCTQSYFLSGAKCIGCPSNCDGCTSANQCFYCKDGFFLHGGTCYATCPAGTIANKDTFQCTACNSPCRTCANHPSSCTSCAPGEGYVQITGTDQKCVRECAEGTFPQNGVCQVCDFKCAKCLGASENCIACPVGKYLYQASCYDYCPGIVDTSGRCNNECPAGYFKKSDQQCKQCSPECSTCSDSTTCLTCANNYLTNNGKCVRECGNGYFIFRRHCVACDDSCKNCANNPLQCTQCAEKHIRSSGRCVLTCDSGQYLDAVSNTCKQCSATCATCSSQQICTTCPNDRITPVGGQCFSCIFPCASCSADLSICTACRNGFYLSSGVCLQRCPQGTRPVGGVCSCATGLTLDGACVNLCSSGYTRVGSRCQRCEFPCTQCSTSTSFCTGCLDTYDLRSITGKCEAISACNYGQIEISTRCSRICDAGLYYHDGFCIFGGCPSGFKDNGSGGCINSQVVDGRCESPTFKLNGVCTENCGNRFFPNTNTRNCEACLLNCQSCLNNFQCLNCVTGFTQEEDGRCVAKSNCRANQFAYNSGCVASCPTGTFSSNGKCTRSCPQGSFYLRNFCYNTCPSEASFFTDNACVSACPAGTNPIVGKVCTTVVLR